jgi:hypothetical protein
MGEMRISSFWFKNFQGDIPLGRFRHRLEGNTRMDFAKIW